MKRSFLLIVMVLTLMVTVLGPPEQSSAHTKLEQATEDLKKAEEIQKKAEQNLKDAQLKIKSIQAKKIQTANDINSLQKDINIKNMDISTLAAYIDTLNHDINSIDEEIYKLEEQINKTTEEITLLENQSKQVKADIEQSKQLLQETIKRIDERNLLLSQRLRYMYISGDISHLEVLMNSTSFSDFLVRFDNLKSLVSYDSELLTSNKKDQIIVTEKLAQVEQQLTELVNLYEKQVEAKNNQLAMKTKQDLNKAKMLEAKNKQVAAKNQQNAEKNRLLNLTKDKRVQISALDKQEQGLAHYTEEQEQAMIEAAALIAASKKTIAYYKDGSKLAYPLIKVHRISSNFGQRRDPITGRAGAMHNGMDFAAPAGTSILAAESGRVITAGWVRGYGNTVILDHGNGLWTLYAHARDGGIKVKIGQTVKRGDKISEVGTTGNSTGNHLHFEVRLDKKAVDPRGYLIL